MPRGDGKGPRGQGPVPGRGMSRGGGFGIGPGGNCACPNCGTRVDHQSGTPCYEQKCPKCGTGMIRE
ncbi:DUF5320 domain-containing protein [Thermodesulfobacteriota bacterium]